MATYTDNLNLTKPDQTDIYNIDVPNGNMDIVDAAIFGAQTKLTSVDTRSQNNATNIAVLQEAVEELQTGGAPISLSFVYTCTGSADSTAIANIVNNFFNNGTAMSMKLIITGTMGVEFTDTYYAMLINATNTRGAVCHLDFSDCGIPTITTSARDFIFILSDTARVYITGLKVTTSRYAVDLNGGSNCIFNDCILTGDSATGVRLTDSRNCIFVNCTITGTGGLYFGFGNNIIFANCIIIGGAGYGVLLTSGLAGIITFSTCKIIGTTTGISADTANTSAVVRLTNCAVKGTSTADINQSTSASTMKWNIIGCSFSKSSISVNGATQSNSTATANAFLYMPAYANLFSQTIT